MTARRLPTTATGTPTEIVRVLAWSPDGTLVVAHDRDGALWVLELASWRLVRRLGRGGQPRFSPDGSRLAFAADGEVHIHECGDSWERWSVKGPGARAIAFGPDRRFAVAGNRDVGVWEGRRDDAPSVRFPYKPGFTVALAFAGDRLVGFVCDTDLAEHGLEADLRAEAPALRRTALPPLDPPGRAALLDDGSLLLRTGGRDGRIVLDLLDAPAGPPRRTIAIPGAGHVANLAASADGATIVLEVGEANRPQQLVALRHAPTTAAVPQVLAEVERNLGGLLVSPLGDALIYDLHGGLWHLPIPGVTATSPAPPRRTPDERRTRALLVAGRAIDSYLITRGQLADIRALLARRGDTTAAIVAGDETDPTPGERKPTDSLYARVVIGVPVAEADCDLGPRGPIPVADLRAGLARAAALGDLFWRSVSSIIARHPARFAAAARRAAVANQRIEHEMDDVALDAADLLTIPDRIHLVPTGPLAHARLAIGVPGTPPDDESIAVADADGLGTASLALGDLDALDARLATTPGAGVFLLARHD